MNVTRSILLLLATVIAASMAWAHWRPTQPKSISVEGPAAYASSAPTERLTIPSLARTVRSPLNEGNIMPNLRADDAEATPRFEESRKCYFAKNQADAQKSVIQACHNSLQGSGNGGQVTDCPSNFDQSTHQETDKTLAGCSSGVATARHFYEAAKAAASAGNADAQACYLQSSFQSDGANLKYSNQEVADYIRDAPGYISDGLARGDWRIVSILARTGFGDAYTPLPLVTKNDAYTQYVMNRLLQLGADGTYAKELERSIQADFLSPGIATPPRLTQQQVANGIKEAQVLYHRSFDRKPLLSTSPPVCSAD